MHENDGCGIGFVEILRGLEIPPKLLNLIKFIILLQFVEILRGLEINAKGLEEAIKVAFVEILRGLEIKFQDFLFCTFYYL